MCNQIGQILIYIYSTKILAIGIMQLRNAFYSYSGGSNFVSDNDHTVIMIYVYKVFVFRVPVNASIKSRHTTYSILGGIRVIREDNSACLWIKCMQFCESIPVIILVMLHAFEETANIFHKVLSQVQYNLCNQIEQIYIGLSIMYMHTSNIFSAIVRQLT